jgi:hypothetical protein
MFYWMGGEEIGISSLCWIMKPTPKTRGTARDALMSDMAMPLGQYDTGVGYWATWKLTLTYYLFIYLELIKLN